METKNIKSKLHLPMPITLPIGCLDTWISEKSPFLNMQYQYMQYMPVKIPVNVLAQNQLARKCILILKSCCNEAK